jgi:hypothetical protein
MTDHPIPLPSTLNAQFTPSFPSTHNWVRSVVFASPRPFAAHWPARQFTTPTRIGFVPPSPCAPNRHNRKANSQPHSNQQELASFRHFPVPPGPSSSQAEPPFGRHVIQSQFTTSIESINIGFVPSSLPNPRKSKTLALADLVSAPSAREPEAPTTPRISSQNSASPRLRVKRLRVKRLRVKRLRVKQTPPLPCKP